MCRSRFAKNNLDFRIFKRRFRKLCVDFLNFDLDFEKPMAIFKKSIQISKRRCHIRVSTSIFEISTTIYLQKIISIFYFQSSISIWYFQKSISIFKNVIQFSSFNLYFQNFSDDLEKWMSTISISILKNRCRFSKIHPFSLSSNWMDSSSTRMGVFGECRFSMLHLDFQKFITIFDFQKSI